MASRHDTMMNPSIEDLLARAESKFSLVTLGAMRPGRSTPTSASWARASGRSCRRRSPPWPASRCRSPSRRSPPTRSSWCTRSEAPEGDASADASAAPAAAGRRGREPRGRVGPDRARRAAHRPRRVRRHRRLQGHRGLPAARRRAARTSSPVMTEGATALRRRPRPSPRWPPSRCTPRCSTTPDPIPHTRLGQSADLVVVVPGHRPAHRRLRRRHLQRSAHRHAARHPGARRRLSRPCTPRCGSTRPCRTTSPRCARRGVHIVAARGGPPGRRRRRRGPPGRSRRHRRGRARPRWRRPRPRRARASLVTAGGTREPIDPVRVISNRSSGKQGYALAAEAACPGRQGHAGHHRRPARPGRRRGGAGRDRRRDGRRRAATRADGADVVVMAAAVADFRPAEVAATQAQEGRRRARDRARADRRHPRRPGRAQAAGSDAGRLRGRDRRRATPTPRRKLVAQGPRPHRRQRRLGPGRWVRARHQPGRDPRRRRHRARRAADRQAGRRPSRASTRVAVATTTATDRSTEQENT